MNPGVTGCMNKYGEVLATCCCVGLCCGGEEAERKIHDGAGHWPEESIAGGWKEREMCRSRAPLF